MTIKPTLCKPRGGSRMAISAAAIFAVVGISAPVAAQTNVDNRIQRLESELRALKDMLARQSEEVKEAKELARKAPSGGAIAKSGNENVSLKIYGQANRAVIVADDGTNDDVLFVDNDMSSSRVGFEGKARVTDTFSVGAKIEVEIESNPSNVANLTDEDDLGSDAGFATRKVEFSLADERLGKLTLGQTSEAHDGAAEVDVSGTEIVTGSLQDVFAGGIVFRNEATGAATGPTMATVFPNFDGSRDDALRYDTPEIYGFVGTAVAESDDRYGFALAWGGKFSGIKGEAMVAYQRVPDSFGTGAGTPTNTLVGSASFIHDSGISLTGAIGTRENEQTTRDDTTYYYGKVGYQIMPFSFGSTSMSVDYYTAENTSANNDESSSWGLGFVQKVDDAALELYAGLRFYDYETSAAEFETISVGMMGGRVKF